MKSQQCSVINLNNSYDDNGTLLWTQLSRRKRTARIKMTLSIILLSLILVFTITSIVLIILSNNNRSKNVQKSKQHSVYEEELYRNVCNGDYSPCHCRPTPTGGIVTCINVSIDGVWSVFNRSSTNDVHTLDVTFEDNKDLILPQDWLSGRPISSLFLTCPENHKKIEIDRSSFLKNGLHLRHFSVDRCDFGKMYFTFLYASKSLDTIQFQSCSMIHKAMTYLRNLSNLEALLIKNCTGFNQLDHFPKIFSRGLKSVHLISNPDLDENTIHKVIKWLSNTSSHSLETLAIIQSSNSNNQISVIDDQLSSFIQLTSLVLDHSYLPVISKPIALSSHLLYLSLRSSQIRIINEGVFGTGDFHKAFIDLSSNKLTRFESSVFQSLLQMNARVALDLNPFDCESDPCHLAWIIRDRRKLLTNVIFGQCSNGTFFEDLDRTQFDHCPSTILGWPSISISWMNIFQIFLFTAGASSTAALILLPFM